MADSIRLFGQFKDERGTQWKVNIHDADFGGSPTEILLASDGFMLQYQGDNESRMQPIIGSALSFGVQVQSSAVEGILGLIETSDEGRFTCSVVKDPEGSALLFWSGIIMPDQVVKQDEYYPILIQIRAVDDLGNLRNVKYKSGAVGYGGEATLAQHLNQCVLKLRHVQNIPWGDPLVWWANNFTATGISPLVDQFSRVGVHHAAFYALNDEGEAQYESAFDVLKAICMAMNCRIFQHHGAFWVVPVGIYGTFTSTASWTFYNIDGPGNISTGETIQLGKIIGTDVLRMVGNEITHLPPLQEVRRIWNVMGEVPAISLKQYLNATAGFFSYNLLGTMVADAGLGYAQNEQLKLEGTMKAAWAADGSLTGQETIGTLFARITIKVGSLYLVNAITYSTTQWVNVSWVTGANNRRPFSISDAVWQSSAGFYYLPIITAANISQERPQSNPWLNTINAVLPALPSQQTGLEITIEADGRDFEGGSISNFTAASSWISLQLAVRRLHENGEQMEAITYVASFDTEAQSIIEQQHLLGSAEYSTGIDGNLLDMTGTPGDPISTFTSLARPTEAAQPLHQIAATEILQGQKHATLIRRGRFFGEWISPLHFLFLGTDKFLPFQTTYLANSCETDFEAFKVAFNGLDMQTPSIQGSFTDIDTSGGSVTDVVLPVLEEAIDTTGKQLAVVEGEVETIGLGLTAVQDQVKIIYETFNPKGADYGTTQVKYLQNKTDGTLMELQQNQMLLKSATGNTQLLLSENSPGIIRMDAQDEVGGTQLAIYATAKSSTGGAVGINTDAPTATLHVVGNAKVQGAISLVTLLAMATDQELEPGTGQFTFNSDQNAFTMGLLGAVLKAGEDDHWVCRNATGSTIAAGVPVYAAGTLGSSGRKLIAPMVADGSINARYFLGVTAHSISNGEDGVVIDRGTIKGINTSSFTDGDVLWISQTTAGTLTATEPATGQKIAAAFVIHAASNGVLAVRNLGADAAGGGGNAFGTIAISGQSDVVADAAADTLTLAAGTNMVLQTDAGADSITIATSSTPTFTSATINSGGLVSVGNISTLGSMQAAGNIQAVNGTFTGNAYFNGSLQAGTAILTGIQFTGGGTTSIGIATGLQNQPADLQITSNGNCTIQLDADDDESSQHFKVLASDGTILFQVDEDGITSGLLTTAVPTISGLPSSAQQGSTVNAASISNFDAATDYVGKVYNSSGVEQTSSPVTIDGSGGISFTAPSTIATGYELRIYAAALGKLRSVEAVGTFEVTASRTFTHWRMQGCTSDGTPSAAKLGVIEMNYWTGTGGTGTKYPTTAATSNTSISGVTISAGHQYSSSYASWEAFDRAGANEGYNDGSDSMWWTLAVPSAADNWNQLEFSSAVTFQSVTVHVYQLFSDATHVKILGSNTGAFSGEEVECAIIALDGSATGAGATFTGNL